MEHAPGLPFGLFIPTHILDFIAQHLDVQCLHKIEPVSVQFFDLSMRTQQMRNSQYSGNALFVSFARGFGRGGRRRRAMAELLACVDMNTNKIEWIQVACHLRDACLLVHREQVYILGGHHHNCRGGVITDASRSCCTFSLQTLEWSSLPLMNQSRRRCGAAISQGTIYVFGGHKENYDTENPLTSSIERLVYTQNEPKWELLNARLPVALWCCQAFSVGEEIFLFGLSLHKASSLREYHNQFLCFNTKTHTFRDVKQMNSERIWCSMCSVHQRIYAIGGIGLSCKTGEVYDTSTDTWSNLPDLPFHIHALGQSVKAGSVAVPLCTSTHASSETQAAIGSMHESAHNSVNTQDEQQCTKKRKCAHNNSETKPMLNWTSNTLDVWVFLHSGVILVLDLKQGVWKQHPCNLCIGSPAKYGSERLLQNAVALP